MSNRAGYSLLEVLIAFAVMAMVLAVLIPGQARLLALAGAGGDRVLALDYAASRLDALGLAEPLMIGTRETVYRTWRVTERVEQEILSDPPLAVLRIAVEVSPAGGGAPLARIETLRPAP
ncbi:MAG: prepilin-type N-terminal cleavage/methylation domain-containing protein [Rhodobacteraceae bacterium]|jgi:type II secretory pathway pseudopilin PulG|nr:prepilin-type N-terminal cleavage/methylation domain-containing protein [Paracoccaceae bacterium]